MFRSIATGFWMIGFLFIHIQGLSAQDFKQDILRLQKTYRSGKIAFSFEYRYFRNGLSSPFKVESGFTKMNKNKYRYKMGELEFISDGSLFVCIDRRSNSISLEWLKYANPFGTSPILSESFISDYKNAKVIKNEPTVRTYSMDTKGKFFSRVELSFNPKTNTLISLAYFRNDDALNDMEDIDPEEKTDRVDIVFSQFTSHPVFTDELFSLTPFLQKTKTGYILQPAYRDFIFINHLAQ